MDLLCEVCDQSVIKNHSECNNYLVTLRKKNDENLFKTHTINNVNLDEVKKILNDYISAHNKNFDFCFINCEFEIEFGNNFKANKETKYFYNTDIINIKRYLLCGTDCFKSRGHQFYNINQMIINSFSDRRNTTYERYNNNPMPMVERRLNMNIAKNPYLINSLDRKKKPSSFKKIFSHTI